MKATCVICKEEFEHIRGNRTCGKHNSLDWYHRKGLTQKTVSKHYAFFTYISSQKRYFQNPIYQFFRLQHSESLSGVYRWMNG